MNSETLVKFIENMRAGGQPDDMIAQSLINAGHNKLSVLNLFGVSSLSELSNPQANSSSQNVSNGPLSVVDASGQPLISPDNLPKDIGHGPRRLSREEIRKRQKASHRPRTRVRQNRTRNSEPTSETNLEPTEQPAGIQSPTQPQSDTNLSQTDNQAGDNTASVQSNEPTHIAEDKLTPALEPKPTVTNQAASPTQTTAHADKPAPASDPTSEAQNEMPAKPEPTDNQAKDESINRPKPNITIEPAPLNGVSAPEKRAPHNNYGHHTFDDFMVRVQDHKELEAHYSSVAGAIKSKMPTSPFKKGPKISPTARAASPENSITNSEPKASSSQTATPKRPTSSPDLVALSGPETPSSDTVDNLLKEQAEAAEISDAKPPASVPATTKKQVPLDKIKTPKRKTSAKNEDIPKALRATGMLGKAGEALAKLPHKNLILAGTVAIGFIFLVLAVVLVL